MRLNPFRRAEPVTEERTSLENPSTSISDWLNAVTFGALTGANVRVNEETALMLPAVYAAITLLSETVAQLPLNLFRREGETRVRVDDHPSIQVIREPNANLTSYLWKELAQGHTVAWGNSFTFIDFNNRRRPLELRLLNPAATRKMRKEGTVVVETTIDGQQFDLPPDRVLHVPAFSYDGLMGKSPITVQREALGLGLATQNFGATFFGNGTHAGSLLTSKKPLNADAKAALKSAWEQFKGAGYAGLMLVDDDLSLQRLGIPPEDAQFLGTRKLNVTEVARIYKLPPHMLGDLERATFSNITEMGIFFARYTMIPWLVKWEEELNRKLLTPRERETLFFKFNVNALMRGTPTERAEFYQSGITNGWMSRNEARRLEDLNPEPELDGFLVPLNMTDAENVGEGEGENGNSERSAVVTPFVEAFALTAHRMVEKSIERLAQRDDALDALAEWITHPNTRAFFNRHLDPIAAAVGDPGLCDEFYADFIARCEACDVVEVRPDLILYGASDVRDFFQRYEANE